MKVKIENFGPVKEFTFDTQKKFHLIVGDNNVGKSYVLTVFYFIVKSLLEFGSIRPLNRRMFFYEFSDEEEDTPKKEIIEFKNLIKDKKSKSLNASSFYCYLAKDFLQHSVAEDFSKKVKSSYFEHNSISNSFSDSNIAKVSVDLGSLSFSLEGNIDEFKITNIKFDHGVILRYSKQNRNPTIIGKDLVIYASTTEDTDSIITKIKIICVRRLVQTLSDAVENILDIDYLPASRSGLYQALSAFGQIIAELSKSRSFLTSKIELPGISGQLSDYFIRLTSIVAIDRNVQQFESLARNIESDVLNGRIEFDFEEKKLFYRPNGTSLRLDISSTSSMVSETAPIVAYIRHVIAWNTDEPSIKNRVRRRTKATPIDFKKILIVEEPEAHLHPANQIKMTRFYAELAQLGVSVIMTSHSNYVFNKASNLVIEGILPSGDVQCDLFQMQEKGSVGIPQIVDDFGINDENFGDASEDLINERMELLMGAESQKNKDDCN
jgi:predicted ATPase